MAQSTSTRSRENQNSVTQLARNNSQCFKVEFGKTDVYRHTFFPRTVRDWSNLGESAVSAKSIGEFEDLLSTHDRN